MIYFCAKHFGMEIAKIYLTEMNRDIPNHSHKPQQLIFCFYNNSFILPYELNLGSFIKVKYCLPFSKICFITRDWITGKSIWEGAKNFAKNMAISVKRFENL